MKLDEFHVRDLGARSPRHRHAIACRDIRIRRVQINFAATAGREHDSIRTDRFYFSFFFVQHVNAKTAVFCGEAELGRGDQIHRHVIF